MKNNKLFDKISKELSLYQKERGVINHISSSILTKSKQSIFLAHDGKMKEASDTLEEAKKKLREANKQYNKSNRLDFEGSYQAAAEEFLEAKFFIDVLSGKQITVDKEFKFSPEEYLGGLCDMTGELVRQSVLCASEKNLKLLQNYREITKDIVGFIMTLYLSGKIRMKFDDAKRNLKRIETIIYEINLTIRK
jgi:predicted translin family RNA/ssDNA-binding protein